MCCDSKGARKRHTHNQIRSGRFSQRRVPCCGTFVICTKEQAPPRYWQNTARTAPTPAAIVTAPLPQRLLRKVGDTTQTKRPSPITCRPSGLPPVTLLPRNARDFPPAFRPYSCYCSAAALPPGFEPLPLSPNRHSPPVQLVSRTTRLACSSVLVQ